MTLKQYPEGSRFPGVVGRTADESSPAWPTVPRAPKGSPNVVFIVLDDTGFGQLGCFGSPIETPNLDALAQNGLRYNNMHTTALCSPSRSCIITGRNHHSNAMACITEFSTGYPGYNGNVPFENGYLSEILVEPGYSTSPVGKWHLIPADQETGAGPYNRWPLGRGFERFYGFLGGDTSQWHPDLVYDNHQVEPPRTPEEGYHLSEDLADMAVRFIADPKQVDPDKPFFLYFCPGATHAPHHVPKEWADKYTASSTTAGTHIESGPLPGRRSLALPPRMPLCRATTPTCPSGTLSHPTPSAGQPHDGGVRGFFSHTDHHIGRVLEFLRSIGEFDNTIVMFVSDNGASAEGGVEGTTNEAHVLQQRPRDPGGEPGRYRRDRWPQALQPLPMGLDLGRKHAISPMEA